MAVSEDITDWSSCCFSALLCLVVSAQTIYTVPVISAAATCALSLSNQSIKLQQIRSFSGSFARTACIL